MINLLYIPQLFGISIEVYFILLLLGTPTYFFWRWVYKTRVGNPRNRQVVTWLSTLIAAPMLYVGIAMLFLMTITYYPKKDFDRKQWLADKEKRYEMSGNMIDSKMLIGKTPQQVKAILGDEDNTIDSDYWHYYLGFKPEIANIDPDVLDITFKNGKVIEVGQHNS